MSLALHTDMPIRQHFGSVSAYLCGFNNHHSPSSGISLMDPSSPFRVRFPNSFMLVVLTWVVVEIV